MSSRHVLRKQRSAAAASLHSGVLSTIARSSCARSLSTRGDSGMYVVFATSSSSRKPVSRLPSLND